MERISVILPVYNEEKCIINTFHSVLEYANNNPLYHFIFVNDGSTDDTQEILEAQIAKSRTHQIQLVSYPHNEGKGYAIKKGLEYSDGDYICFLDSDLAYSLSHLEFLVDKLDAFDVVIGCRNLISSNLKRVRFRRRLAGKLFNKISREILSLDFRDMQAGIKGFRKDVAIDLFEKQTIKRFCFDVELIYLAKKKGYSIGEIPAIVSDIHFHKVSKVNIFIDSLKMLISLIKILNNDKLGRYEEVYFVKF